MLTGDTVAPRRGRPAKAPDERLSEIVSIRVSPRDADAAYQFAQKHGKSLDEVFRAILRRVVAV